MTKGQKAFTGVGLVILLGAGSTLVYFIMNYQTIKQEQSYRVVNYLNSR
ncbi:MAG: hypothetical protein HQM12_03760 [SAR324 cluster bacterium]|nr:hypothetical protein [SAR324 cluster bacterium]MBF0352966.1 hypothetical protein [SAR324 cluster bacterium]